MGKTNKRNSFLTWLSENLHRLGRRIRYFFRYNVPGEKPRAWELDFLRGIIMLVITVDHCCGFIYMWNLFQFETEFGLKLYELCGLYCNCEFRLAIQPYGLFMLCFLSGINRSFSRSNFQKVIRFCIFTGLFMGGYALLKYLFPTTFSSYLMFNIVPILTICYVVWWLLDLIKCPSWIRGIVGFVLIGVGLAYFYKFFVLNDSYVENEFLSMLVYNSHGRNLSPDNFEPLLPHLGFFLLGGFLGKYLYPEKKTLTKREYPRKIFYPVLFFGKHSLVMYVLGPCIFLAITWITFTIVHLF